MPRQARVKSNSGCYHVMLRGINRQNIFEDDEDRIYFLEAVKRYKEDTELMAWCLMNNHVHMLVRNKTDIPNIFLKKTGCSYVPYFNKKYGRFGHLFQDRYKSEAVEDDAYIISAIRYIHQNPVKAGICPMEEYKWSSYREYLDGATYCDTEFLLSMLSGREAYISLMNEADTVQHLEDVNSKGEKEAVEIIKAEFSGDIFAIQKYSKPDRDKKVMALLNKGLRPSQIIRITGIGKTVVYGIAGKI